MQMLKKDLESLLNAIIAMEHKTTVTLSDRDYSAIVRLAQTVQAPQYITEYFARKQVELQTL